jgi:uncharacterized protein YoxC
MNKLDVMLIAVVIISYIIVFLLGYLIGKINSLGGVSNIVDSKSPVVPHNKNNHQKVSIDTTKIVTSINTDNLEKKYTNLGEVKQSTENISESVNKLKNMKG